MDESSRDETPGTVSRRDVLTAALGAVGGGLLVSGKEAITDNTIETAAGRFTGIYELHPESTNDRRLPLPPDTDIFFRESGYPLGQTLDEPEKFILSSNGDFRLVPTPTLLDVAHKNIFLAFGDPHVIDTILMQAGETGVGAGIAVYDLMENTDKKKETVTRRRTVLKGGLGALSAWGLSSLAVVAPILSQEHNASNRILSQFTNIVSMAHPEDMVVFFRNALMAEKMLFLAEEQKKQTGKKSHIAFNVGWGHRGIEDFLLAGREMCQKIITLYPSPVLRKIAEINGGVSDFSSALLYKLPENLSEADIQAARLNGEKTILVDDQLAKAVREKIE